MNRLFSIAAMLASILLIVEAVHTIKYSVLDIALKNETEEIHRSVLAVEGALLQTQESDLDISRFEFVLSRSLAAGTSDPDHLYNMAYSLLTYSYFFTDQHDIQQTLAQANTMLDRSIELRPTYSDAYALKAYIERDYGEPSSSQFASLSKARKFGPYEHNTMIASTEIYLSYWSEIATDKKILVSNYILKPNLYGLSYQERDELLLKIGDKEIACDLLGKLGGQSKEC